MSVLQTALAYANKSIRVVPIKQGEKRPPMQGWQNAATSDPTTIRTWFEGQFKDCGLGIATGDFRDRYLIVIDIDDREQFSGSDTLADLEELNGKLPETVEVITGSGGRHIYFLTDQPIRNEASGRLGQGIDIRGIGGQVLAPPTVHPNGKTYEWVEGRSIAEHKPADMPLWMVLILTEKPADDIPMTYESTANILTEEGPASRYCAATTWPDLLRADGWTLAHIDQSGEAHWIRPGKDIPRRNLSDYRMARQRHHPSVHHINPNLPAGAYTRFGYTAAMHHNNDRSALPRTITRRQSTRTSRTTNQDRQHPHQLGRVLATNIPRRRLANPTHHPTQPARRHLRTRRHRQITTCALHRSRTRNRTKHIRPRQQTNPHPLHGLRDATSPTL